VNAQRIIPRLEGLGLSFEHPVEWRLDSPFESSEPLSEHKFAKTRIGHLRSKSQADFLRCGSPRADHTRIQL
jgi:hypothetical protein